MAGEYGSNGKVVGRIRDYRNSTPRNVKIMAAGAGAQQILRDYIGHARPNVLMERQARTDPAEPLDSPVDGRVPNAVVVVYVNGETVPQPLPAARTASMLSLVVVEQAPDALTVPHGKIRALQAVADLYVTTSDAGFFAELVDNLSS